MRDNHGCGPHVRGQDKVCDTGVPYVVHRLARAGLGLCKSRVLDGKLFGSAAQGLMMVEYARE
jgi:hypothetical protein